MEGAEGSGNDGTMTGEASPVRIDASGRQAVVLTVTDFYLPTQFTAKAGVPTTLLLRGKDSGGCARAFTTPNSASRRSPNGTPPGLGGYGRAA
ncbi:hypothetical protein [Streptomyces albidochromogenes]|uniref:hypothetical protein n=1 Tax=Streptomyces albidochromogenes TaxID=329524 RepID=UPI00110FEA14|nr:hypothetical protein [Streptomyces albidochromogenes]